MRSLLLAGAAALLIGAAPAKKPLTPNDIVAQAPASDWREIPADDLLVMDLKAGRLFTQSRLGQPRPLLRQRWGRPRPLAGHRHRRRALRRYRPGPAPS